MATRLDSGIVQGGGECMNVGPRREAQRRRRTCDTLKIVSARSSLASCFNCGMLE